MGLDISAYSKAEPITRVMLVEDGEPLHEDGSCYDDEWPIQVYADKHWPWITEGLEVGRWYEVGKEAAHAHFSYGGYNRFREAVALTGMGVSPREVWNDPDRYRDHPLFGLVNFSDCEGVIGPVYCQRIHEGLTAPGMEVLREEWGYDNVVACFAAGRTGLVTFG